MSYQVLARKWRPQSFEEVVGQETVVRTLQNAIRSGHVAHAFLFAGVRGVGKTTTARILAKALNCTAGPTPTPCGECDPCREIALSNCVDVLEIDAASNTGVDNIRELTDDVRYGTVRDRFKIFIIDEVHMLSKSAFNALLKTLEEPPPHVKFILATTELHKIPSTIVSRCQRFTFKPIPFGAILERLERICREEGIEISEYGLRAIVSLAQGSMRDAQSALDQVTAFAGSKVEDADVRATLGVVDESVAAAFIEAVAAGDRARIISGIEELQTSGVDAPNFCRRLIEQVRNLMVYKAAGWEEPLLHLPEDVREEIARLSQQFSQVDLIRFYDQLTAAEGQLRWHARPFLHLEITLMKLIELGRLPELEEVIGRLQGGPGGGAPPRENRPQPVPEISKPSGPAKASSAAPSPDPLAQLLKAVEEEKPSLLPLLEEARLAWEGERLEILFPEEGEAHYKLVRQKQNQKILSSLCARIRGLEPVIEVRLAEGPGKKAPETNPTEHPKVKAFIEAYPGKVIVERIVKE